MKYFISTFIFLLTFGVYLYTTVPCLTQDDSGELAGVGATLGIAHSPGYPFYSLAGKITNTVIPYGNPAYRINFMNGMFIAGAALVLFLTLELLTANITAAAIASLIFAFSKSVWAMANVTEVYGIAAFISCLLCLVIAKEPSLRGFLLAAYLYGVGMTAHYTIGLFVLGLMWWMLYYYKRENSLSSLKLDLPKAILVGLAGFSLVLFIYIRAQSDPVFGWEDPKTFERFWQVIARLRYGTASLAQGGAPPLSPQMIWAKLEFYFTLLNNNITFAGIALFIIGLIAYAKDKLKGWTYILLLLGSGPGFLILANTGIDKGSAELLERFFFLSQILVVLILGFGLSKLPKVLIPLFALLPGYLLASNFYPLNHRNEFMFYDYGKDILRTVPPNSILLSDRADEMEFTVAYLLNVNKLRPDIYFNDCNAGVTRSIYGDDYYVIWGKPRLQLRTQVESSIIRDSKRPVYYATFEPEMIPIPRYQEGLLYRAKPAKALIPEFPYSEVYAFRPEINVIDNRTASLLLSHYYLLGKYYLGLGKPALAERFFNGVEAYDERGKWILNIGFQFHQAGYTDYALRHYRKSIDLGYADSATYTNLGVVYKSKNDISNARLMYGKAIEEDPQNYQAYFNLAVLYWEEQNWNEVIKYLEQALKINPNSTEAAGYLKMARQRIK